MKDTVFTVSIIIILTGIVYINTVRIEALEDTLENNCVPIRNSAQNNL